MGQSSQLGLRGVHICDPKSIIAWFQSPGLSCLTIQLLLVVIENPSCAQHDNGKSLVECFHLHKRLVDDDILMRLQLLCRANSW